jgi:hypothetical protein
MHRCENVRSPGNRNSVIMMVRWKRKAAGHKAASCIAAAGHCGSGLSNLQLAGNMFPVTHCYIARGDIGDKKMFFKTLYLKHHDGMSEHHFLASYERKLTTTSHIHK